MGQIALKSEEKFFATKEEYLHWESQAEYKSEYRNGEVVAMAGGTINHNRVCRNVVTALQTRLRGKNCEVFNSDMRLDLAAYNHYVYPDAMVICGKIELAENRQDIVKNPILIVEVLSPSTADYDRGEKFRKYQSLASFKEYLIVSSESKRVETFYKVDSQEWRMLIYENPVEDVLLSSLDLHLSFSEIYESVSFEEEM